jgi:hypothetical protein
VSLAHLDVSHNSLHHLAPQLSSLVALTQLEASDNKLHQSTAVPEELVALTALKVRGGDLQELLRPTMHCTSASLWLAVPICGPLRLRGCWAC